MIINALNSGANVFMADFEDSNSPTWDNVVEGQLNLSDAVDGSIRYVPPGSGFSTIKTLRSDPAFVMPDRGQVTMEQPFLRAYTQLLVKTCHRRGVHAMGGMAAQIPIKDDPEASRAALDKVRADKLREVGDGHDGTWVAHPGLVAVAREVFDAHMTTPNQIHVKREDVHVTAEDLLRVPQGTRTEAGLRHNVRVGVQYLESWLLGSGCVLLYDHGGRRQRRDLAHSGLAMDPPPRHPGRRPAAHGRALPERAQPGNGWPGPVGGPEPLRRRALPRSRRPLRPDVDVGGLRGVPDAAGLRFAAVIVAPRRA